MNDDMDTIIEMNTREQPEDLPQPNRQQIQKVIAYREMGWPIIDLPLKSKSPSRPNWQNERWSRPELIERFQTPRNVGLLLGLEPNPIIDIDLDQPESKAAARLLLTGDLSTGAVFGRPTQGIGHYLYRLDTAPKYTKWHIEGMGFLEMRSTGHQTVIPDSVHESGERIVWKPPFAEPRHLDSDGLKALIITLDKIAAISTLAHFWPQNARHEAAMCLAGGLARAGYTEEDAVELIQMICDIAGDEDEAINGDRSRAVNDTYRKWASGDKQLKGWPGLEEVLSGPKRNISFMVRRWLLSNHGPTDEELQQNDVGNATRFISLFSGNLRVNIDSGQWLAWEGTRWQKDRESTAQYYAERVGEQIIKEALAESNPDAMKRTMAWGKESGNRYRIRAMVETAKNRPELGIQTADLDSDPLDVNVLNGTFNLERMELRPHSRDDYLTKMAPITYDQRAKIDERWERFLDDITDRDDEFRHYLQKCVGYSLTGLNSEDALFMAYGPAATGKSTFLQAIRSIIGDYGTTLSTEALLASSRSSSGAARPDIVKLIGVRMATASEFDEGRYFGAMMKDITGGDTITGRALFQNEVEFKPKVKVWIATNFIPGMRANDSGTERRLVILDFKHQIPEEARDRTLRDYLCDTAIAGPALFNWAIEGYHLWKREGLAKPDVVKRAIATYAESQDTIQEFLDENTRPLQGSKTSSDELQRRYIEWCRDHNHKPVQISTFRDRLSALGYIYARPGGGKRIWRGLEMLTVGDKHEEMLNLMTNDEDGILTVHRN